VVVEKSVLHPYNRYSMLWIVIAQTWTAIWSEDFEGVSPPSLPGDWAAYDLINPDSNLWSTANNSSDCISGYSDDDLEGYFTTKVLCLDDASASYRESEEWVVSSPIWIGGYTDLRLSYDFAYEDHYDSLFVEVRFWEFPNWGLWTRVAWYYDIPEKAGVPDTSGREVIFLTGMASGKDSFQIRILWSDYMNNWGWGVAFDNFLLEGRSTATGISENADRKPLRLVNRTIYADKGTVYDVSGHVIARFRGSYTLPKGIFFVRTNGRTEKIIVR